MSLEDVNKSIEELYEEWRSLQPLKQEDYERLWKKMRLDWNWNSNHIEGNTLTYGETELLLIEGKETGIHPQRDYMEMKAHDVAINMVKEFAEDKERNLTEADVRDLNKIILKETFWKEALTTDGQKTQKEIIPGQYKKLPNHVRTETGEIFKFAEPAEVPAKMEELMKWFKEVVEAMTSSRHSRSLIDTEDVHDRESRTLIIGQPQGIVPTLVSLVSLVSFLAELHHRFIVIHPFDDGNGRIARLWVNYVLLRLGYPPMVIRSKDKRNYFAALQRADKGYINTLAVYLGKTLISWLEVGIKAAKGEDISEPGDIDKEWTSFLNEEKNKGFMVPLSQETAEKICDELFMLLFEKFEEGFRQFNVPFLEKEILVKGSLYSMDEREKLEKKNIPLLFFPTPYGFRIYTHSEESINWKENLKALIIEGSQYAGDSKIIRLVLNCRRFRGECKKSFDMTSTLSIDAGEFHYKTSIKVSSVGGVNGDINKTTDKKTKTYNHIWSEREMNDFLVEGKENFVKVLKESRWQKET